MKIIRKLKTSFDKPEMNNHFSDETISIKLTEDLVGETRKLITLLRELHQAKGQVENRLSGVLKKTKELDHRFLAVAAMTNKELKESEKFILTKLVEPYVVLLRALVEALEKELAVHSYLIKDTKFPTMLVVPVDFSAHPRGFLVKIISQLRLLSREIIRHLDVSYSRYEHHFILQERRIAMLEEYCRYIDQSIYQQASTQAEKES